MHADPLMRTYAYLCSRLNHPNYCNELGVRVRQQTNFKLAPITQRIPPKCQQKFRISKFTMIDIKSFFAEPVSLWHFPLWNFARKRYVRTHHLSNRIYFIITIGNIHIYIYKRRNFNKWEYESSDCMNLLRS